MAALVPVDNPALEALDPSARELAVTSYLTDARDRLALALHATGPAEVAALKAEIATAAEATKQLGLSKEIQQDAQEMVRRAEYALGKAIRQGQERGEIKTIGDGGPRADYERKGQTVHVESPAVSHMNKMSARDFFTNSAERVDTYSIVDGVTESEFEAALSDARGEGNLSRANVVRKVKGVKSDGLTPVEKLRKIRELAPTGMTSGQIAKEIGCTEDYVRQRARDCSIEIPADKILRGTHRVRVDANHVVDHAVMTLDVIANGVRDIDLDGLDETQVQHWADSLTESIRVLNRFAKSIKEKAQ